MTKGKRIGLSMVSSYGEVHARSSKKRLQILDAPTVLQHWFKKERRPIRKKREDKHPREVWRAS